MSSWIERVRTNALEGRGRCSDCPAFEDDRSCRVNPGLFDPHGEVMFVTIEPSHRFDWDDYEDWAEYNEVITRKFVEEWTGGPILAELLEPIDGLDMASVWMTDAIKCPPEGGLDDQPRNDEFAHCKAYLQEEIEYVDPDVIVGLGANACRRTLAALGVERTDISTAAECGRIVDTDPPVVISPHWSHGWLRRETSASWGDGWLSTHSHLQESSHRNMEVVRASIQEVRSSVEPAEEVDTTAGRVVTAAAGVHSVVRSDSHRGSVCEALSTTRWMDCRDVADAIGYSTSGASSVLSDLYRADYVNRRQRETHGTVEYEYRLKSGVEVQ
ncbi:uracil-DNA glycosylase family protein [Haloarchaeobius sp. HRN-SO-5]|uniref:uracil-DNA glycosylase family protein n=1 Tax=Haloarchaeobius sp. HRN-SO-5 TaxID=3446118 RepID=UPI003EB6D044